MLGVGGRLKGTNSQINKSQSIGKMQEKEFLTGKGRTVRKGLKREDEGMESFSFLTFE